MILTALLTAAWAQTTPPVPDVDAHTLRPSIDSRSFFVVDPTGTRDGQRGAAQVLFGYANAPLVVEAPDGRLVALVEHLTHAEVMGGYTAGPVRIGARIPVVLHATNGEVVGGLGDMWLDVRGTLLHQERYPVGLAIAGGLRFPTATALGVALAGGWGYDARVNLDGDIGPVTLGLTTGFEGTRITVVDNLAWGNRWYAAAGVAGRVGRIVELTGELSAHVGFDSPVTLDTAPLEALFGVHLHTQRGVVVRLGGGAGLTPGFGTPTGRALLALAYEQPRRETAPEPEPAGVALAIAVEDAEGRPIDGAAITVDGRRQDDTGWVVPPGDHAVEALAEGFTPLTRTVTVPEGERFAVVLTMATAPGPEAPAHLTLVVTDPDGAPLEGTWSVDGGTPQPLSLTQQVVDVPAGSHVLSVEAEGHGGAVVKLELEPGADDEVELMLKPPRIEVRDDHIELGEHVYFATDKAEILPESDPLLRELAHSLYTHPEIVRVRIGGHTDERGAATYNLELSQARADAVVDRLVELGIARDRMEPIGFGEGRPLDPRSDPSAWAINRRVEVWIVERVDR